MKKIVGIVLSLSLCLLPVHPSALVPGYYPASHGAGDVLIALPLPMRGSKRY